MKTRYSFLLLLLAAFGFSCTDKYSEELTVNAPVYLSYEELRSAVAFKPARSLVHPGKIYFKGDHLFVVESLKGVHVIDVSVPSNPQNTGFIEIPGCVDIAIKGQSLYADSFVDLVTIDISDLAHPKETKRFTHTFSYTTVPPEKPEYPCSEVKKDKGVVVGWEIRREVREIKQPNQYPVYNGYYVGEKINSWAVAPSADAVAGGGESFGKSGSMARFGLNENFLYVVEDTRLRMYDTETPSSPVPAGSIFLNRTIETMFIYDGHIFFGTPSGMIVYSLQLAPEPVYIGEFWHVTSCDPVVVQDGYAYITLRAGTACGGGANRLDVVKMSDDYKEYELVSSYSLTNPYGLGIDGDRLFVCDGSAGLKIYDTTDKEHISSHLLAAFPQIRAYDVIPADGFLFMVGDGGFYLYDYSDYKNIQQIGHIPVETTEEVKDAG
jgi:hypothetical protein